MIKGLRMKKIIILCLITMFYGNESCSMDVQKNPGQLLIEATEAGNINELEKLVESGVNINTESHGATALLVATYRGDVPTNKWLIEHGADVNLGSSLTGTTPLQNAARRASEEITQLLLDQPGIEIDKTNQEGETALMIAASHKLLEVCKLLVDHKANINLVSKDGTTALMNAVFQGDVDICALLLANGADARIQNQDEFTALDNAVVGYNSSPSASRVAICWLLINEMIKLNEEQKREIQIVLVAFAKNQKIKSQINKDAQNLIVKTQADQFRRKNAKLVLEQLNKFKSPRVTVLINGLKKYLNEELDRRKGF